MQKLKEGDFVNYKFRNNHLTSGTIVEIIKIPEGERQLINQENNKIMNVPNCYYQLLRLDIDESVSIHKDEFYRNCSTIEIENQHFIELKSTLKEQIKPLNNETINFYEWQIEHLSFIQIIHITQKYPSINIIGSYYLVDNKATHNQDYFDFFFKKTKGLFGLNEDLEKIHHINQLFDKLDSINYHYNKKKIANLKQDRNQQSN
ncbi:hypothetical protein AAGV33_04335 [Flavobacterium sp. FBOR7N2.3]|uniref:Uncharacterized protein n=1 Tax=Flavobacterium magnesitis TaxID=3138077 RepID=A0ABV4TKF5_9FLAO